MTIDRFAEKYTSMNPYQYGANNPILNIDVNGDSIRLSFIGDYSQHSENKLTGMINNNLEGQFSATYEDIEYDEDNEIASGTLSIVPTKGGGDINKMSLNGQEFYRELTELTDTEGLVEIKVDYARSDVHTGNFDKETMDVADILQFNEKLSELGGTQGGKIIHEFREQYSKQVLGNGYKEGAHGAGIQSENNVNLSVRREGGSTRNSSTQTFRGRGGVVNTKITYHNRRVIKVENN